MRTELNYAVLIHVAQAVCTAVTACLLLPILLATVAVEAPLTWSFALCFITILILSYQILVSSWSRARWLTHPYVDATSDVVFAAFWLTAFAAIAAWVCQGIRKGSQNEDYAGKHGTFCSSFEYGTEGSCKLGVASLAFAILLFILFCTAACLSIRKALLYWEGILLPEQYRSSGKLPSSESLNKRFPSVPEPRPNRTATSVPDSDNERDVLFQETETEHGRHPGRKVSYGNRKDLDVDYDWMAASNMSPAVKDPFLLRVSTWK